LNIVEQVTEVLSRHDVANNGVALALSGGVDSMVLLDIVSREIISNPAWIKEFQAIHVNHGISPNAGAWADFCVAECRQRNVPIAVEVVTVARDGGQGLEAAARAARYAALMKCDAAFVLTAQHQDDQAETVLHQLLRGTGLNGLAGMGETRALAPGPGKKLLRPLLKVRREEIETYAAAHGLKWVEDESNSDTKITRNYLRHCLVPAIRKRFPHYAESLARTSRHAAEAAQLNEALAELDLRWDGRTADVSAVDALPLHRQVNALYHWLRWQKVDPPSHAQLAEWAAQLFRAAPEGKAHRAGGHGISIRRHHDKIMLE
jgi:tRNA(Ile)-lysidine synthase